MFYFSLAEKLGLPVGEMLRRMDSSELAEWRAFYEIRTEGQIAPQPETTDPEELTRRMKIALFKKGN